MKIVKGCLIDLVNKGSFDIFAHGCNCKHAMGAGIAPKLATAFPQIKIADDSAVNRPGSVSSAYIMLRTKQKVLGMNWYTQHNPGANFNIAYLQCVIEYMRHDIWDTPEFSQLDTSRKLRIGVPLIGCGIGGGDARQAMGALAALEAEEKYEVTLVLWQPAPPTLGTKMAANMLVQSGSAKPGPAPKVNSRKALLNA